MPDSVRIRTQSYFESFLTDLSVYPVPLAGIVASPKSILWSVSKQFHATTDHSVWLSRIYCSCCYISPTQGDLSDPHTPFTSFPIHHSRTIPPNKYSMTFNSPFFNCPIHSCLDTSLWRFLFNVLPSWRCYASGVFHREVSYRFTDVSELLPTSTIKALIALTMETGNTLETSVNFSHTSRQNNPGNWTSSSPQWEPGSLTLLLSF